MVKVRPWFQAWKEQREVEQRVTNFFYFSRKKKRNTKKSVFSSKVSQSYQTFDFRVEVADFTPFR